VTIAGRGELLRGSRQKSRLLRAATKLLSEKAPQAAFSNVLVHPFLQLEFQ
jgi:hypothetical protein